MISTDIVITGLGIVSPIGVGRGPFWAALVEGRSGVGPIRQFDASALPVRIAAEVNDFDPKAYVAKRKSLKLMSRDAQLGVAASVLACQDAGIVPGAVDPDRFGVILAADRICTDLDECWLPYKECLVDRRFDFSRWGTDAMWQSFPLLFLKVLPNMIASHVAIAQDARGPNNTIHMAEPSALLAVSEAVRTIERGAADLMIVGGASAQVTPTDWIRHCVTGILSPRQDDPATIMRPFDGRRDGQVWGEGAATFIVERRSHAIARGATILAQVIGCSSTSQPRANGSTQHGASLVRAIGQAIQRAEIDPKELGHVNAHGLSMVHEDRIEARALHEIVPDVPVFAPKSYFGNLGAAGGAVEVAASVLALNHGIVPATLNYEHPDPECPIRAIRGEPHRTAQPAALLINWTAIGQAAAVVLAAPA